jgi:F0F1-type ATP synthase membrane subunit b/b'
MSCRASLARKCTTSVALISALVALLVPSLGWAEGDGHGSEHADSHEEHGEAAHGEGHGGHEINWFTGFLAESDEWEPNILWREPGTPAPFGATLLNTAILLFILVKAGKKPVAEGLKKRKALVMKGIDDASKMKADAEKQLAMYEAKLEKISEEVGKLKAQLIEAAEADREQTLTEARQRRERMERDARILVEQELKAVRDTLVHRTASDVVSKANALVAKHVTAQDHQRVADSYLDDVQAAFGHLKGARS